MIPRVGSDGSFQSTSSQPSGPQQQRAPVLVVAPHNGVGATTATATATAASAASRGRPSSLSGSGQQATIAVPMTTPATVPLPAQHRRRPRFFPFFGPMRYVHDRVTSTAPTHALPVMPVAAEDSGSVPGTEAGSRRPTTITAATNAAAEPSAEERRGTLAASKAIATSFSSTVKAQEQVQRRWVLMISMACILLYIALGIGVYGFGIEEWGAIKAAYFSMVTMTTIGFGDLAPSSEAGKGFTIVFALLGVSCVALSVGEISAYLIEKHDEQVEQFNRALAARLNSGSSNKAAAQQEEEGSWLSPFALVLVKAVLPVLVVNVAGAGLIGHLEGWTALDSLYYAIITSTTIGYGDLHPTHTRTYLIAVFYCPFAVVTIGSAISQIAGYYLDKKEAARRREVLGRKFQFEELFEMDGDGDGTIDKHEFTIFLLKLWKVVDDQLLAAIHQRFKELDTDGSGRLTREDFLQLLSAAGNAGEGGDGAVVSRAASASSFASVPWSDLEGGARGAAK